MFTGLVEEVGRVEELLRGEGEAALRVRGALFLDSVRVGDSLAVDGACLTVSALAGEVSTFDLGPETRERTTLQFARPGDRVHLERALSFGGRLGGHLVSGHVDGMGEILSRTSRGRNLELLIRAPRELACYLVPKGSVAVDGVSLTVNQPRGGLFVVTLVPHTLSKTVLGERRVGARVNLEGDILGKYVRHFAGGGAAGIDERFLAEHGFLDQEGGGGT